MALKVFIFCFYFLFCLVIVYLIAEVLIADVLLDEQKLAISDVNLDKAIVDFNNKQVSLDEVKYWAGQRALYRSKLGLDRICHYEKDIVCD